jgi:X-X-X-Leu-X-X-Gly heptad repeat protein
MTAQPAAGTRGPRWRALLEARWQARVREVTELSLAYHVAAAAVPGGTGGGDEAHPEIRALLRRAVAARRRLADTEEALGRLAGGRFGSCEQCGAPIPAGLLGAAPETRYCPRCDAPSADVGPSAAAPSAAAPSLAAPSLAAGSSSLAAGSSSLAAGSSRSRSLAGRSPR